MKRMISIFLLSILLFSVASAFVSDRVNISINPKIDGDVSSGFGFTRDNTGTTIELQERTGFGAIDKNGYLSWNTTGVLFNSTDPTPRIEDVYAQLSVSSTSGFGAGDTVLFQRMNLTDINSSTPEAQPLDGLIEAGTTLLTLTSSTIFTGNIFNASINVLAASSVDIFNQKNGDGYYSLGITHNMDDGDDVDFDSQEGGFESLLIVQRSCAPPRYVLGSIVTSWVVNKTCVITDEQYQTANITIQESGWLIMNGTTEINSTKENSNYFIRVVKGGKVTGWDHLNFLN